MKFISVFGLIFYIAVFCTCSYMMGSCIYDASKIGGEEIGVIIDKRIEGYRHIKSDIYDPIYTVSIDRITYFIVCCSYDSIILNKSKLYKKVTKWCGTHYYFK